MAADRPPPGPYRDGAHARGDRGTPHRRAGLVLAGTLLCWSLAQNSLWGVSGRIGIHQARLSEVTVGAVFAIALGTGLVGVIGAGALGSRLGRAVPIGAGTALIAGCIALSASAHDLRTFATGEIAWNTLYPIVLSYVLGLAASLDPRGRWAVLVGSASSLGTAAGPLAGSVLSARAGFPAMGAILAVGLVVIAVPMTGVALHTGGRLLVPGTVRRRGGTPAAVVAASTGSPCGTLPRIGAPEQPVVEIPLDTAAVPAQGDYDTAGPGRRPRPPAAEQHIETGPGPNPVGARGTARPAPTGPQVTTYLRELVRLHLGQITPPPLLVVLQEGRHEGVPGQLTHPLLGQAERRADRVEIVARVPPKYAGSSELTVQSRPASSIAGSGCSARTSTARSRTFERGQRVSGTRSRTSLATSSASSMQRRPWSTRSTPRTSSASVM